MTDDAPEQLILHTPSPVAEPAPEPEPEPAPEPTADTWEPPTLIPGRMRKFVVDADGRGYTASMTEAEEAAYHADIAAANTRTPTQLKAYAANKRWEYETGGCDVNGHHIATDRDSQSKLITEFVALQIPGMRADPSPWKMRDGTSPYVSNTDMAAICVGARNHVTHAFTTEAYAIAQIDAGTITAEAQIDALDWPSNT